MIRSRISKPEPWYKQKEAALNKLGTGLKKLGVIDPHAYINIAIEAIIRHTQPKLEYPSDRLREQKKRLKNLVDGIEALDLELRFTITDMYGRLPAIDICAVEKGLQLNIDNLDPNELRPPKEEHSLKDWIARQVLPLIDNPVTTVGKEYRELVELIYIAVGLNKATNHPCRHALNPPETEAKSIAAKEWRDNQIDQYYKE